MLSLVLCLEVTLLNAPFPSSITDERSPDTKSQILLEFLEVSERHDVSCSTNKSLTFASDKLNVQERDKLSNPQTGIDAERLVQAISKATKTLTANMIAFLSILRFSRFSLATNDNSS